MFRATFGEKATWGASEHLLAALVDLTNLMVWFKSTDGQKNRNRPKPIPRPDDKRASLLDADVSGSGALKGDGGHIGTAMTIAELEALLARTIES